MARFHGEVGYGRSVEEPPDSGNWVDQITEFPYTGDVIRNSRNLEVGDKLNSDISLANSISIVADQHAVENFAYIKYVRWMGEVWTVTTVDASRPPRLILSVGGVYNGPVAPPPPEPEEP